MGKKKGSASKNPLPGGAVTRSRTSAGVTGDKGLTVIAPVGGEPQPVVSNGGKETAVEGATGVGWGALRVAAAVRGHGEDGSDVAQGLGRGLGGLSGHLPPKQGAPVSCSQLDDAFGGRRVSPGGVGAGVAVHGRSGAGRGDEALVQAGRRHEGLLADVAMHAEVRNCEQYYGTVEDDSSRLVVPTKVPRVLLGSGCSSGGLHAGGDDGMQGDREGEEEAASVKGHVDTSAMAQSWRSLFTADSGNSQGLSLQFVSPVVVNGKNVASVDTVEVERLKKCLE